MAGAIRYQTNFFNIDGIEFQISIFDKSYSGAIVSDFETDNNGFELKYDSGTDDNYSPIIGSELTLNIVCAVNAQRNDTTLFAFLKSMVAQNEQTYYIIIKEKVSGSFVEYWRGNIVQNQSAWNNDALESGCMFQIIANDFAYLNEKPFELITTLPSDYTLRNLVHYVLTELGIYNDFATDILYYFLHNINWFEETVPVLDRPTTDILATILTYDNNFTELNEDRTENEIKFIDVLKTIMIIFGSRLVQSGGKFYAIQLQNYTNTTSKFYQQGIDANNQSTVTVSPRVAVSNSSGPLKILQGGQYNAIRPLYSVFIKKPSLNSLIIPNNQKDPYNTTYMTSVNSTLFMVGGGNNCLKITANINCSGAALTLPSGNNALWVDDSVHGLQWIPYPNVTSAELIIRLRIKTTGGTWYYLYNNPVLGILQWRTTASSLIIKDSLATTFDGFFNINLVTPEIPNFDFNTCECEMYPEIEGWMTIPASANTTPPVLSFFNGNFSLKYLENGSDENEETTYRASISPKPFDPKENELEQVYLYDTEIKNPKGTMIVNISPFPVTNDWAVGTGLTYFNILELVVINAMAMNRSVKEIIACTIKGQYYPHQLLTYDSKQWHLKQATFNAQNNQWNGEWFELTYSETGITVAANTSNGSWTDTVLEG
jgi:hypothetical protein